METTNTGPVTATDSATTRPCPNSTPDTHVIVSFGPGIHTLASAITLTGNVRLEGAS